jgi:uncharacterized tellurite resistance protein B-like protein
MLESLKRFLSGGAEDGASSDAPSWPRHAIAAAVLMAEAAQLDDHYGDEERSAILAILMRHFTLDETTAQELLSLGEIKQEDAVELYSFTRRIKQELEQEEHVEIIEMLWEVAYADGVLHEYEEQLVRRVAGLIYVSDRERGDARKRVLARLGIEG